MTTNETKDTTQDGTLSAHSGQIAALQSQIGAAIGTGDLLIIAFFPNLVL